MTSIKARASVNTHSESLGTCICVSSACFLTNTNINSTRRNSRVSEWRACGTQARAFAGASKLKASRSWRAELSVLRCPETQSPDPDPSDHATFDSCQNFVLETCAFVMEILTFPKSSVLFLSVSFNSLIFFFRIPIFVFVLKTKLELYR